MAKFLKTNVGVDPPRTLCSVQNRWNRILHYCTKWRGILSQIANRPQSGAKFTDEVSDLLLQLFTTNILMKFLFISNLIFLQRVQAINMFQADVRSPWIYDHCWKVLKYYDKWMIIPQSNPRPRSPCL